MLSMTMPRLRWRCLSATLPPQSHLAVPEKAAINAFYFAVVFEGVGKPHLPSARLISNTHFLLFKRLPLTRKESHAGKT